MPNRVSLSLRYVQSLRDFLANWMMDISITNPRFDDLQHILRGLNEILQHPEQYGLH